MAGNGKTLTDRKLSRRKVLKGTAAAAGLVAGSKVIGAPTIWAQNI
ncbi:MAG: twin-arginine translocation signal domain-containing protein, partial [Alphaproteobacteria bacterium]